MLTKRGAQGRCAWCGPSSVLEERDGVVEEEGVSALVLRRVGEVKQQKTL
jgi:hypothetical protein